MGRALGVSGKSPSPAPLVQAGCGWGSGQQDLREGQPPCCSPPRGGDISRVTGACFFMHLKGFCKLKNPWVVLFSCRHIAVFPCKIKILPQFIFNSRDPIVMGVTVEAGQVKQGTPMCVPSKNFVDIGIVTSIEVNHKQVDVAKKGQEVCVKIEPIPGESPKMYGRHFEATDILVSKISRQSIDALKDWFRDEMQKSDWQLIVELKKVFEII